MKVMVEGHVPAWCYVDTDTGEVELIEIWAWDEEFSFEFSEDVIAENAEEDGLVTRRLAIAARGFAHENCCSSPLVVARCVDQTLLGERAEARVKAYIQAATSQGVEVA